MGAFQASMLEAFNNLCEDFQKSLQKQKEVDQTSSSAHKTNAPSKHLDKPSKDSSAIESMEVEYGPDLPPCLDSSASRLEDDLGQVRSSAEDPSKVASTRPKHSSRHYTVDPSSASDHYSDYSNDPQPVSSRPKKHSDKSKHKSRSDSYPPLQRRISPLNIDIGPLSPPGSHILIRTTPNMTLTLLIIGK